MFSFLNKFEPEYPAEVAYLHSWFTKTVDILGRPPTEEELWALKVISLNSIIHSDGRRRGLSTEEINARTGEGGLLASCLLMGVDYNKIRSCLDKPDLTDHELLECRAYVNRCIKETMSTIYPPRKNGSSSNNI